MTPAHAAGASGSGEEQAARASVVRNRIMSWNSNGQKLGTPQLVAEQIRRFRPQIVLLQESCHGEVDEAVRILKRQGLEYDTYHGQWSDINLGCDGRKTLGSSVLAAKGTKVEGYGAVRYDERDWFENRNYTMFTTRLAGRDVRVFNTQLSDAGDADLREEQVHQLMEAVPGVPNTVVAGDLNAQPWYGEMARIWAEGFSDVDPFCKKTWDRRCNGTQVGSGKKFDYILHKGLNSRKCMLHTVNNDHRVVVSDLTAGQGSRRPCSLV
ncbi:endonuclease/exonuclease/phosphatase family protein [Streptomyces sp. NPDC059866]|uniref:endonuclease/exonuclease/phosphatase family protein n=1 Tax=Streptomyces sp. NPDC059866 TaxID=3346978 RepID=UPI00365933A9